MTDKAGKPDYADGVFSEAVAILATHPGPIKQRLLAAWDRFRMTFLSDMPTDECRELFTRIMEGLKGMEPLMEEDGETVGTGSVEATLLAMSDERAEEIGQWIVALADRLEEWCSANDPNSIPPNLLG